MRQIDARRRAEPARLGKTLDAVDAELLAEHIIIHVARMQERLDHIHGTVPPLPPTPEFPVAELHSAGTHDPERGGDALLEEKPGHHELPDRAGRVHALMARFWSGWNGSSRSATQSFWDRPPTNTLLS